MTSMNQPSVVILTIDHAPCPWTKRAISMVEQREYMLETQNNPLMYTKSF